MSYTEADFNSILSRIDSYLSTNGYVKATDIENYLSANGYVKAADVTGMGIPQDMTVTDADGNTSAMGTCVYYRQGRTSDPYMFYAKPGSGTVVPVNLVTPLGGDQTGLYRFPKVGEKVMVMTKGGGDSAVHYMMGYLPDTTSNPIDKQGLDAEVFQGQGQVFRYRQTGKTTPEANEAYSEIGFYHKETLWNAADKDKDTFADNRDTTGEGYLHPKVDHINIHSTGDIHESAVNHHRVQARRLELLAGKPVDPNRNKDKTGDDKIPLGTGEVEWTKPNKFKQGELYIKAAKNITIEAGETITLKVGRTTLTISDDRFSVSNQLMSVVPNPVDATISLNVRDGVAISGQTVGIEADRKWSISDKFGAGISGTVGIVNMGGRELSISNQQITAQLAGNLLYMLDYITKLGSGGLAISAYYDDNITRSQKQKIIGHVTAFGKWIVDTWSLFGKYQKVAGRIDGYNAAANKIGTKVNESGETFQEYNLRMQAEYAVALNEAALTNGPIPTPPTMIGGNDPSLTSKLLDPGKLFLDASSTPWYEKFAVCLDWILSLTKEVYKQLNSFKNIQTTKERDNLNFASLVVDQTLIATATGLMLAAAWSMEGSAAISLGYDGSVTVKAAKNQNFYAITKSEGAATASLAKNWALWAKGAISAAFQIEKLVPLIKACIDYDKSLAAEKPEVL